MKQKTVLITGGARGIGRAIALELAAEQYQIVINYLHSSLEAEELQNEISSRYGVSCMAIQADVSSEDEVEQMFSEIDQKFGGTDVLINNAAVDLSNLFHLKMRKAGSSAYERSRLGKNPQYLFHQWHEYVLSDVHRL